MRWLDATGPAQRAELFAGLPRPAKAAATRPLCLGHRALCRQGLRLRMQAARQGAPGEQDIVWLHLRHQPRARAEAPLLVLDVDEGVRCVLIETHERDPAVCQRSLAQNLHAHIQLARGAACSTCARPPQDRSAHFVHATLAAGALRAGAGGHRRHTTSAAWCSCRARAPGTHAGLLLAGTQAIDHQIVSRLDAPHTTSQVEGPGPGQRQRPRGGQRTPASPPAPTTPRCASACRASLAGQPRMVLRPHLEILHDQVQAVHGATWGALPKTRCSTPASAAGRGHRARPDHRRHGTRRARALPG
jgi:Fe-S cluster assembly protein SufD